MRIGLTQRVEVSAHGERRDCLDQRWQVLLGQIGYDVVAVPNRLSDPGEWVARIGLQGLILTGGNDLAELPGASNPAPERDRTEARLLEWAAATDCPVLGVCRGLQLINVWQGGVLGRVDGHVACRHELEICVDGPPGLSREGEVNSFHAWGVPTDGLGEGLEVLARDAGGSIEALRHHTLPWLGIMWHPEREQPFAEVDLQLIRNHFGEAG